MDSSNKIFLAKTFIVSIYPIQSSIGLITNIIAFVIFSRIIFKKTIFSTYFRFLIIFDMISSIIPINKFFEFNFNTYLKDFNDSLCKFRMFTFYVIFPISGWTLVVISFDRYLSIKFPKRFSIRKKTKFQILVCIFILVLNLIYYTPNLFFHLKQNNISMNQSIITYKCNNPGIPLEWMNIFESTIVPFLLMFLFTSFAIRTLNKIRKNSIIYSESARKKDIKFALTSVFLNILFFVINFPLGIYTISNMYFNYIFSVDLHKLISSLVYLFAYFNSMSVFFINIIVNRMFRK